MEYKDRTAGLTVFGVLTIGLGCLCALLILFLFVTLMIPTSPSAPKVPTQGIIPGMAMYGMLAIALVWLGIGSIMAKRWARALMLIFSWSWLVAGTIGIAMAAIMLPTMLNNLSSFAPPNSNLPPTPPAAMAIGLIIGLGFDAILLVVVPAVWTYFYNSRHVKATCEARHPQPSWTDACPLPVLGVVCWLAFSALIVLGSILSGFGVIPFFGAFLTGGSGMMAFLILGALYFISAYLMYRLDVRGWWIIVGVMAFWMISGTVTFMERDILDMYRAINYPQDQIELLDKTGIFKNKALMFGAMALFGVPIFGYLIYVRRYFQRPVAAT